MPNRTRSTLPLVGLIFLSLLPAGLSQTNQFGVHHFSGRESNGPKNVAATASVKSTASAPVPDLEWRRTVNGWEPSIAWSQGVSTARPPAAAFLHPIIVTLLQALLSLAALLSFERFDDDTSTDLQKQEKGRIDLRRDRRHRDRRKRDRLNDGQDGQISCPAQTG